MKSLMFAFIPSLVQSLFAMPQDSTTYFFATNRFPNQACFFNPAMTVPASGLQASMITDFQYTVHSDPVDGKINVDVLNHPGSNWPNLRTTVAGYPGKKDRGGDGFLQFSGSSLELQANPGCAPHGDGASAFLDYPYTGAWPRWLKVGFQRSGTSVSTVSQPFAIQSRTIPIGRFNWGLPPEDAEFDLTPLGDFGIEIRRIVYYKALLITDVGGELNPGFPDKRAYLDMHTSSLKPYNGAGGYFSEKENAFVFGVGTQAPNPDPNQNRGYVTADFLAAQCSDGAGGYTGTNVGSRTLAAFNHAYPFANIASYAGCHGTRNGIHVIESTGDDIWGTNTDKFRYAHKAYNGNKNLIVRVDQLENTNAWARAGIMIRAGTAAGDRNAAVFVTPGNGLSFQARTTTNAATTSIGTVASVKAPIWLRLDYNNGTTRAYYGSNGTSWTQIGNGSVSTYANYRGGLAAASRSAYPNTSVYSGLQGF